MIVFANEILVCYLLPVHIGLHRLYHMYTTLIHVGGHAGYEMAPFIPSLEGILALFIGGSHLPASCLNTVRHHDMHHRYPNVHFSLYMTHWDRLMGTEHKGYRDAVEEHFISQNNSDKSRNRRQGSVGGGGAGAMVVAPAG
jgi:lathosterol oxidase